MINGVAILWGSLKQTVVVDSTCSAEYVAASICCKQIMPGENMVQFSDFMSKTISNVHRLTGMFKNSN